MQKMMDVATQYIGQEGVEQLMAGDFSQLEDFGKKMFGGDGSDLFKNILDKIPEGNFGRPLSEDSSNKETHENTKDDSQK